MTEVNQYVAQKPIVQDGAIVIFDSGLGGLSVYQEVRKLLPQQQYIYVFDNAGFPYGEKNESFIIERAGRIINAITARHRVSLVIIACNSASTISLPSLRTRFKFPVVGVVPAIKPAVQLTKNGLIGLLATRGTVKRQYTQDLISQFAKSCQFSLLGSAELVDIAERKLRGEVVSLESLSSILRPWLDLPEPPDTIVLGCTHFPLIQQELMAVLPAGTQLVDSGNAIARRTAWLIENYVQGQKPKLKFGQKVLANKAFCTELNSGSAIYQKVMTNYCLGTLEKLAL